MQSHRIILIEDDTFVRELYAKALTEAGFEGEQAIDGEAGLAKLTQGGFDLILLDIKLPKKDGLSILTELKNHPPQTKNGPVVLLTNFTDPNIINRGLKLGAVHYLDKADLVPGQLVATATHLLSTRQ